MSGGPRKPAADPVRKARFRETARAIVFKDRDDRKDGRAVDTAGAIARALERAYRQGFEDAQCGSPVPARIEEADEDGALDWALIPPRPRSAFWSICLFILGRGEAKKEEGCLVSATTGRGGPAWRLTSSRHQDFKTIGESSILPLIRLGLISLDEAVPSRLLVSSRGEATWRRFLERGGQYPEDLTDI